MRKILVLAPAALIAMTLAACGATVTERAATGALGGAAIGAAVSGDAKGALAGAAIGGVAGAATTPRN
ncbi:hypothetical protein [Phenylobacterium sp.]|uniref:hypothetical protein n=1 Tax=Phenylobacterium sp. TaxID=1871053 RepID=UPI0027262DF4|nr:hypothetical protein [Phenylobacterium sp.]MDO8380463.1 hypothetical protein [Phenylobacterium sp.]